MNERRYLLVLAVVALGASPGCKKSTPAKPSAPSAAAPAPSAPGSAPETVEATAPRPRCRQMPGDGLRLTLGAGAASPTEEDEAVDAPFSPELGGAAAAAGGFAVGLLEPRGKTTNAAVVVLAPGLPVPKRVDLGAVHGDVLGPRVVTSEGKLLAVVPDGAPNGTLLRFARIDDPAGTPHVAWGAEVLEGNDESDAFAFEAGAKATVLAWDEWDKKAGHGVVKAITFAGGDVGKPSAAAVLSGEHDDAEAPALVARAGGFWAAWLVDTKRAPDRKDRGKEGDEPQGPLELGPRYVVVAPLDEAGKLAGAPSAVTPKEGHVMGFDVAAAGDGSALVAWRDDRTSPGTAGGTVRLEVVRPDGSVEPRAIADEDVGAGAPSLLVDAAPPAATHGMLTLANDADALRIVSLDEHGRTLDDLAVEPGLGLSTALALHQGQLLVARPAGKGLDVEIFTCEKGAKTPDVFR
jgi:hypothetical protein